MMNLSSVIFFLIACNRSFFCSVFSRGPQNSILYNNLCLRILSSRGEISSTSRIAHRIIHQCATTCQSNSAYQYQPVWGTNGFTYYSPEHIQCVRSCGVDVRIRKMSPCSGQRGTTARPTQKPQTTTARPTTTIDNHQACLSSCKYYSTSEYNPVCGSDNTTYRNPGALICAQSCGKDVQLIRHFPCPGPTTTVEPVTTKFILGSWDKVSTCKVSCRRTTGEFKPVCGTNGTHTETFLNLARLNCAKSCGVDVTLLKSVPCQKSED